MLSLLCCYVVKLGKAKKIKHPKKVEVLSGIFYKTNYGCMCQSYCFFGGLFCCFSLLLKNAIIIGLFDDFDMLIFSFLGQKIVGSITWPR